MPQRVGGTLHRFLLLTWKNTYIIRKRHWIVTLLEIIVPMLMFLLLALLLSALPNVTYKVSTSTIFPETNEADINNLFLKKSIHYAPENKFTKDITKRISQKLGLYENALKGYESEKAVINYFNELSANESYIAYDFAAIIFEGDAANPNDVKLPDSLNYKLRLSSKFHTQQLFPTLESLGPNKDRDIYLQSGFTSLQLALDKSYIEMLIAKKSGLSDQKLDDEIYIQKMPYPPYVQDTGLSLISRNLLPIFATLSFIILCVTVVKRVVDEKQSGARELMRLMGMEHWVLWASWLVDALLVRIILVTLIVVLLKTDFHATSGAVFHKTDGSLLYFMLLLYTVPAVTSCFAISTFFSRPTIAVTVSVVLWILQIIPAYCLEFAIFTLGYNAKMALLLIPNIGLYYVFAVFLDLQDRDIGGKWSNLFESGSGSPEDISMGHVMIMFIISSILFTIITWYVTAVSPGQYGVALPWYFPFTKDYWLTNKLNNYRYHNISEDPSNFESPLSQTCDESDIGVSIRGLTKTYAGLFGNNSVHAVQGLSLDLYQGKITALLGHNGAGKTTTMSILTGMIGASSGKVTILGHDLATDLSVIRSSLGLCPQHNLLFTNLTVIEHLIFYAMSKFN